MDNVERQRTTVEQSLSTLATKAGLNEMRAEIRVAVQADGIETRQHIDIVCLGLSTEIRMIAEGIFSRLALGDTRHHDVTGTLNQHDRRFARVEASRSKRR